MELAICPVCASELVNTQCPTCGEFFVPRCSRCGNTLVFEQVDYGGVAMLRCGICSNEMDFELTSLGDKRSEW